MRLARTCCLFASAFVMALSLHAQRADVAVSFTADRSLRASSGQNFWMEGGSVELGVDAWKGVGFAANVAGTHSASIGNSGIPISLVTATFGPRFRWSPSRHLSLYGEGLAGEANGFKSFFPVTGAPQTSANGLATQVGGGIDLAVGKRFAVRALEASWLRTTLPNATDNIQNALSLGAGLVLRWGK